MKSATRLGAAAALIAPLILAGCGDDASAGSGPRIVTSYYALQYVAERVAGEHGTVVNLTGPGQEPHDLELSLRQAAEVEDADVVVYQPGFQSAVDGAVDSADPDHAVSVEAEQGENPHLWLDPAVLTNLAAGIESALSQLDPAHASDYEANVDRLEHDLSALVSDFEKSLADCAITTVVVSHDAFSHLPTPFTWAPINGLSPNAEPSPAHIAELRELIEQEGITTVFNEELASAQMADTLADDLGLQTAVLDPIEGLSDETSDEDYVSLMRGNLEALRKANDCR